MDREASVAAAPLIAHRSIFEYERDFGCDFQVGPSGIRTLKDFSVDSLSVEVEKCRSRLKVLCGNLRRAVNNIRDLCMYVSNEELIEKIKEEIERGDFTQLTKFITQLRVYIASAESSFREAEKEMKEVHFLVLELVTECRMKAQEAKAENIDRKVGAVASGAAAGVLGVMVGATILSGLATGLGIGAVYYISSSSATWERAQELGELSEKIMSSASVMLDFTRAIKRNLESVSRKVDIVNSATEAHESASRLVSAFDHLCQKLCSLDPSMYQEQLRTMNVDF